MLVFAILLGAFAVLHLPIFSRFAPLRANRAKAAWAMPATLGHTLGPKRRAACSYLEGFCFGRFRRHGKVVRPEGFDVCVDGFLDILNCRFASPALAQTSRQAGALRHPVAILSTIENYLSHL